MKELVVLNDGTVKGIFEAVGPGQRVIVSNAEEALDMLTDPKGFIPLVAASYDEHEVEAAAGMD